MACFLVPTAEAIVTGVVSKVEKKNEAAVEGKIPFSRKLKWLKNMLWGGAALLAYEHVWHGEFVPPLFWRFSPFQDTIQCSATHRKEKAPGEVQVKMIVETVKLAAFILCILEKYDTIRNPVGRFSFLKNSAFFRAKPHVGI